MPFLLTRHNIGHAVLITAAQPERVRDIDRAAFCAVRHVCWGLPFRLVAAISSSCCSVMDCSMDRDAPFKSLTFWSPRLADSAAPAAFCWAWDFAGISASFSTDDRNGVIGGGFDC